MIKVDENSNDNKISRLCSAYCFAQPFWDFFFRAFAECLHTPLHISLSGVSCGPLWGLPFPTPARPGPRRRANTQTNSKGAVLRDHSGLCRMLVPQWTGHCLLPGTAYFGEPLAQKWEEKPIFARACCPANPVCAGSTPPGLL